MSAKPTIEIPRVDHIGIRVRDLERAMKFYAVLGFTLHARAADDAVAVIRNEHDVEINPHENGVRITQGPGVSAYVPEN